MENKQFSLKPPPLPPEIDKGALLGEIIEAHKALGRLSGLMENLLNPTLIAAPLLAKEAVLSSRIEGTHSTVEEAFVYDAEGAVGREPQKTTREQDTREVNNYRKAVFAAEEAIKKQQPITERLVKHLHAILLDSVRGARKTPGEFRREQVFIGKPGDTIESAAYVPPPPQELPRLMSDWERYVNTDEEKEDLIRIGVAHYQFEAIHPFSDGNGRIGRLLIPLMLYERNLLPNPALYISGYFDDKRDEYYDRLHGVDETGHFEGWLRFFFDAVSEQSRRTQRTVVEMNELYHRMSAEADGLGLQYARGLVDFLFERPAITHSSLKHRIGAARGTTYSLIDRFVEAGLLEFFPSEKKRNRVYICRRLIEVLSR